VSRFGFGCDEILGRRCVNSVRNTVRWHFAKKKVEVHLFMSKWKQTACQRRNGRASSHANGNVYVYVYASIFIFRRAPALSWLLSWTDACSFG